jgi:hypothetical protein
MRAGYLSEQSRWWHPPEEIAVNISPYYATDLLARERTNDLLRTAEQHRLRRAFHMARKATRKARRQRRLSVVDAPVVDAMPAVQAADHLRPLDTGAEPANSPTAAREVAVPSPRKPSTVVEGDAGGFTAPSADAAVDRQAQPVG